MKRPVAFVLAASDHGPMIVNRFDFHQLPTGAAYGVGHQILSSGAYDPGEIADVLSILVRRHDSVGPGVVALDLGANIGVHTVEMAKAMAGWGQVLAVEAQDMPFYALCGNVALANCFNVRAIHAAVGAEPGRMAIPRPNYSRPASFGSLELRRTPTTEYIGQGVSYAPKDLVEVRLTSVDELCAALPRVDFIKIDVEGMELDVLRGAEATITRCQPTMLIEWIKSDRAALDDLLSTYGYTATERGANLLATSTDV